MPKKARGLRGEVDLGRLGCHQEGGSRGSRVNERSSVHEDVRSKERRQKIMEEKQIEGGGVQPGACKV